MLQGFQRTSNFPPRDSWIHLARQCYCWDQWICSQWPWHLFLHHTHWHCKLIPNGINQVRE
jgi:hypothetical protein